AYGVPPRKLCGSLQPLAYVVENQLPIILVEHLMAHAGVQLHFYASKATVAQLLHGFFHTFPEVADGIVGAAYEKQGHPSGEGPRPIRPCGCHVEADKPIERIVTEIHPA